MLSEDFWFFDVGEFPDLFTIILGFGDILLGVGFQLFSFKISRDLIFLVDFCHFMEISHDNFIVETISCIYIEKSSIEVIGYSSSVSYFGDKIVNGFPRRLFNRFVGLFSTASHGHHLVSGVFVVFFDFTFFIDVHL